jgi:hypothetical protein
MIWAGNFNHHHPLWDRDEDIHLFTRQATRDAEGLVNLLADYEMEMVLPKGIPMLQHMRTKKYSRPDNYNVFSTPGLQELISSCEVVASLRSASTDHFPIVTRIQLPQGHTNTSLSLNFRETDWDDFRSKLKPRLQLSPDKSIINSDQKSGPVRLFALPGL